MTLRDAGKARYSADLVHATALDVLAMHVQSAAGLERLGRAVLARAFRGELRTESRDEASRAGGFSADAPAPEDISGSARMLLGMPRLYQYGERRGQG